MRIARNIFLIALAVALAVSSTVYAFANAPEKGSMGVWGYVANAKDASIEIEDQLGVDTLVVDKVVAPGPAWVVVHTDDDGMPGERVGLARIDEGESTNVEVRLSGVKTQNVIVAVHADKGASKKFEFDAEDKEDSPDRPFFVGGEELAKVVAVREFGVKDPSETARVEVADQSLVDDQLLVDLAGAPAGAWIVVHLNDDGMPGERVGLQPIPAGDSKNVAVVIDDDADLRAGVLVAIHADLGTPGVFDFDMEDKLGSPDQPYFVDGEEVATAVKVRR